MEDVAAPASLSSSLIGMRVLMRTYSCTARLHVHTGVEQSMVGERFGSYVHGAVGIACVCARTQYTYRGFGVCRGMTRKYMHTDTRARMYARTDAMIARRPTRCFST